MKKKMSREERSEFKNGKYMGGPAEERAEKKKKTKRMMDGGMATTASAPVGMARGLDRLNRPSMMPRPPRHMREDGERQIKTPDQVRTMVSPREKMAAMYNAMKGGASMPIRPSAARFISKTPGGPAIIPNTRAPIMKGGGLARKGVGMALSKGGIVKANGKAQRGKTRGKMC